MERLTKREGKHTVRIGNEWRRHDPVWDKLAYYEDLEEQGRLIVLTIQDIHPCRNCDVGWGTISFEGCHTCEETCGRLKEYNKKF
jgi:hypothetical protein